MYMLYTDQLQELYDNFKGKELESALGVTTRSIQNYLKKDAPTIPGKDVIVKIREAYANYKNGKPLINKESEKILVFDEIDFQQPIIQVILNLSYIGKKNADSMDKMAATNQRNTDIIAALVGAILPNSKLSSLPIVSPEHLQTEDNRSVEEYLGQSLKEVFERQQKFSTSKETEKHK